MADPNLATRAPESDAQENIALETSPTHSTPIVGEHCVTDRPTRNIPHFDWASCHGEIIQINDVNVYISKPSDYPHTPAKLLLLLTGGTGLQSTNNQIQADKFASEEEDTGSLLDQVRFKAMEAAKSFLIDMWLARHTAEKVLPILYKVIDGCKEKYADAVQHGEGIHAVGYCIGGRYVLLLGNEKQLPEAQIPDEETGAVRTGPLIKAGALAHGASVTPDDFAGLKVPVSLACVENDPLFPEEVRTLGEDAMESANLEHEVKVYPGVPHGFAVVGQYEDSGIKEAQATAYDQMLSWINAH
ncbi:unnamed protein product [Parascedosporium putredinis]|uniref:Dienelactone hydrolase domain-containing protein n=1 Tax=Parascedosporium putredinis TaxID=1442378 RepID=A0A9P1H4I6_9PEZI|nr:unnamed protein product [Parascedosporium putredinis]CAI7995596.1 unnamed protein product [Parascedosporium putredinis]